MSKESNSSKDPRRARGRAGEESARRHLKETGYQIIQSNFRTRYGELDIIARHGDVIVFAEVKARRDGRCGEPVEAVTPRKQDQIRRMASMWVANHQSDLSMRSCEFRFDVVSVILDESGQITDLRHIEDAFR